MITSSEYAVWVMICTARYRVDGHVSGDIVGGFLLDSLNVICSKIVIILFNI